MRILFVVPSLSERWGGTTSSISGLALALRDKDIDVQLAATELDGERAEVNSSLQEADWVRFFPAKSSWRYSSSFKDFLESSADQWDIIQSHGLWLYPHKQASLTARRLSIPLVITPHGMLNPWALAHKQWKKRIYYRLVERQNLTAAALLHVFTKQEEEACRSLGLPNDIRVVPNGVTPAGAVSKEVINRFRERFNLGRQPFILFLGRLYPVKGLDLLIPAFARQYQSYPGWRLVIAGPDQGEYRSVLETSVKELGIEETVRFTGPLAGEEKTAALGDADIFCLTSYSEGQSMAILEALAAAMPLLITNTCNFSQVEQAGAGLVVEPSVDAVAEGLSTLLAMPDGERRDMGLKGEQLVDSGYSWPAVADAMIAAYSELLRVKSVS